MVRVYFFLPDNVTMPCLPGTLRRYVLQKSGDSRAKKTMFPRKYPAVWPTVLHVEAHPTLRLF